MLSPRLDPCLLRRIHALSRGSVRIALSGLIVAPVVVAFQGAVFSRLFLLPLALQIVVATLFLGFSGRRSSWLPETAGRPDQRAEVGGTRRNGMNSQKGRIEPQRPLSRPVTCSTTSGPSTRGFAASTCQDTHGGVWAVRARCRLRGRRSSVFLADERALQ